MKLLVLGLLVSVSHAGSLPKSPQLAPITLFTQLQQPAPAAVMNALHEEVAAILAPAGFHFRWHELASAATAGISVELAVVTFHGTCDVPGVLLRESNPAKVLGFTSITDGQILPFTTVDCERIQSFLANALAHLPPHERPSAFGRALGRVLAHELYHIFANTSRHGHNGVAKEAYTVADLMAEDFELDERECEVLRSSPAYNMLSQPTPR